MKYIFGVVLVLAVAASSVNAMRGGRHFGKGGGHVGSSGFGRGARHGRVMTEEACPSGLGKVQSSLINSPWLQRCFDELTKPQFKALQDCVRAIYDAYSTKHRSGELAEVSNWLTLNSYELDDVLADQKVALAEKLIQVVDQLEILVSTSGSISEIASILKGESQEPDLCTALEGLRAAVKSFKDAHEEATRKPFGK